MLTKLSLFKQICDTYFAFWRPPWVSFGPDLTDSDLSRGQALTGYQSAYPELFAIDAMDSGFGAFIEEINGLR